MARTWLAVSFASIVCLSSTPAPAFPAEPLPGTKPLTETGDIAALMVEGIHKYLDRETAASVGRRRTFWKPDFSSAEAHAASVGPNRDRLRTMLGVVDARLPPKLEYLGGPGAPAELDDRPTYTARAVRWAVLPGVDAEGLMLTPKGRAVADVVALPDADQIPEQVAGVLDKNEITIGGYRGLPRDLQFARMLAEAGCRVLVPSPIDRRAEWSANPRLRKATNQPHREFLHRMAFEMGRTLVGYEVQTALAAADWFASDAARPSKAEKRLPLGIVGYGEGGRVALYAAALDERFRAAVVSGAFGPREGVAGEPLDRNLWGELAEFGDAELGLLVAPRTLFIAPARLDRNWFDLRPSPKSDRQFIAAAHAEDPWPEVELPMPQPGRVGAAPGEIRRPTSEAVESERRRMVELTGGRHLPDTVASHRSVLHAFRVQLVGEADLPEVAEGEAKKMREPMADDPTERRRRQFDHLVAHTQKLWRDSEPGRKALFAKADASSPEAWDRSVEPLREHFHAGYLGKLPEPAVPLNPRTRRVYDEPAWTGYEVMLDVYPDVFAQGILLLPKGLKPGERRPVVVCQHGLEGTPRSTTEPEPGRVVYAQFARKLVEKGYVVYAPQNPYYGEDRFRQINRKANPLRLSLFSFIVRQHQRTLDFLETLPQVDPKRIAFYGLSYGGKTAMRVPAVEKRYCLSICSGDFNEWIGKVVSVELDRSYTWTREYEMYEFGLGNAFGYAEMAALIAPRPFMVERGHDDGVGTDEMVAYEFAKVRYLYENRLKLPGRAELEFFVGGHRIHGKGTFAFLARHLEWGRVE